MKLKVLFAGAVAALLFTACNTSKDIPYMIGIDQVPAEVLNASASLADPVIVPGDQLQITVTSGNPSVPDAVKPFNRGGYINAESGANITSGNSEAANSMLYYLVDSKGDIEFPMLGTLHVGGMTKSALASQIESQIYPRYLNDRPGVEVRLHNFKVFLLGEVGRPGMVTVTNERMNILEAISMAGDLTIQGKRDNVLVIRTDANGKRATARVSLNDKSLITSPYFNLQQNDIIYVEPNATKARSSWSIPPALTLTVSSLGTIMSIVTFVVALTK